MAASLEGLFLKIERATEHFESVREVVKGLAELPLDHVTFERDDKTDETVLVLKELPTPDPRIGVLIGDCLQNLRAALEHLAVQLVTYPAHPVKEPRAERIAFPIFDRPRDYSPKSIAGSTPSAHAIIRALQPYHAGRAASVQPLSLLRQLANWDKHRLLHTVVNSLTKNAVKSGQEALVSSSLRPPGPLVAGAELARYRIRQDAKVRVVFEFAFGVAFKDGPARDRSVIETLGDIQNAVLDTTVALTNELALDEGSLAAPKWASFGAPSKE